MRNDGSGQVEELTRYLRAAGRAGTLDAESDPKTLARHFGAVIQGMSVQAHDGASPRELERVADVAMLAWPHERA